MGSRAVCSFWWMLFRGFLQTQAVLNYWRGHGGNGAEPKSISPWPGSRKAWVKRVSLSRGAAAAVLKSWGEQTWSRWYPSLKNKSNHGFWTILFFLSQPRVNQNRDFHTNTALGSVGNCEFSEETLHIPTKITCLALQRVVVSFISNRGVTLMSVHVFWCVLKCSPLFTVSTCLSRVA